MAGLSDAGVLCMLLPLLGGGGNRVCGGQFLDLAGMERGDPLGLAEDLSLTICGGVDRPSHGCPKSWLLIVAVVLSL